MMMAMPTPTTTVPTIEMMAYRRFDLMQTQNELMSFQWIDLRNALPPHAFELM